MSRPGRGAEQTQICSNSCFSCCCCRSSSSSFNGGSSPQRHDKRVQLFALKIFTHDSVAKPGQRVEAQSQSQAQRVAPCAFVSWQSCLHMLHWHSNHSQTRSQSPGAGAGAGAGKATKSQPCSHAASSEGSAVVVLSDAIFANE